MGGRALFVRDRRVVQRREGHGAQVLLARDEVLVLFVDALLPGGQAGGVHGGEDVELPLRARKLARADAGGVVGHPRVARGVALADLLHVRAHLLGRRRPAPSPAPRVAVWRGLRRGGLNGLLRRGGRALLRAFAFKLLDARPQPGHRFVVAGRPGRLPGGPLFDRCLRRSFGRGGPDQIAEQRAADERRPGDQGSCTCLHGWKYSIRDRQSLGVLAFPAGVMALTERIERRRLFPFALFPSGNVLRTRRRR